MADMITSRVNPLIKETVKLVASGRERRRAKRFVLEGIRLCFDVLNSAIAVETLFYTEAMQARFEEQTAKLVQKAGRAFLVTEEVASRLADTPAPQGIFCVCEMPLPIAHRVDPTAKYIALEHVQDPSNLGAACRTAEALGIRGAILSGCCDAYSPKAMRSSMGSLLRLPLLVTQDLGALLTECKEAGMAVLAAVPDREAQSITRLSMAGGAVALIGNEGAGLLPATQALCTERVTIPMQGRAESLNASMAATIFMWEMMRGDER